MCKQQRVSSNKLLRISNALDSNWLIIVLMTVRLDIHVSSSA